MKKAYIHVGLPKTGTTSLQEYLYENFYEKKNSSFYFPQKFVFEKVREIHEKTNYHNGKPSREGLWSKGHHLLHWYPDSWDIYSGLLREINDNRNKNIILSCENFHESHFLTASNFTNFLDKLGRSYDIVFVCYLQNAASHIRKVFYEISARHLKDPLLIASDFEKFTDNLFLGSRKPFSSLLQHLPGDNTVIRFYDSRMDTVSDFMSVIGDNAPNRKIDRKNSSKPEVMKLLIFRPDQVEKIKNATLPQIQKLKDKFPSSQEQTQKLYESTITFQQK